MAGAAYRSGEKLVNEWDGMTHGYTRKGGWKNHREDTADNKLLKEIKARITRLYNWSKEWEQYQMYKPVRQKLDKATPAMREQFEQRHSAGLALFDAAVRYLDTLKASGEAIAPKAWRPKDQPPRKRPTI